MKILLIGANGQLGWELKSSLAALGTLTAFDHAGFDLTRPDQFTKRLRELKPEIIVNAAAYTAVDRAEGELESAHTVNALAPGILGIEAKRLGALLVHFSTDYVFDGELARPYGESDKPNPLSVYGKSKLEGELAIQASDCRHQILRIAWVYGVHGANFLKTILKFANVKVARDQPELVARVKNTLNRPELRVVNDQWGAPISTLRLAGVLPLLLEKLNGSGQAFSGSPGLYHLSPLGCTTWYEYALHIVTRFNINADILPTTTQLMDRPAKRPANSLLDSARFLHDFNLSVGHWHEGFEEVRRVLSSTHN